MKSRADKAPEMRPKAYDRLVDHRRKWESKPLLREIYAEWFRTMATHLRSGKTLELGSGPSRLSEYIKEVISSEIVPVPWVDVVLDASQLPFRQGALTNLVMLDVFHHLDNPSSFLDDASNLLPPGGRVVLIEPYLSPFSRLIYRLFHEEPVEMGVDPFSPSRPSGGSHPFDGNMAIPTLVFFRNAGLFEEKWPEFKILRRELFSYLLYPLSGGYGFPSFIPPPLLSIVQWLEQHLHPFRRWIAFRVLIVLEKK